LRNMHYQKNPGRPRPQSNFSEERSIGYNIGPRPERPDKRETNQLVFGIRAVMEAIEAGKEMESLFVQRGLSGPLFGELKTMLNEHQIPFQQVPIEKLNRLSRKNHQGVIGVISPISYQPLEEIVTGIYERG